MISICRTHASNVKRWRDGQMALRWCAAGMVVSRPASSSAASTATCTSDPYATRWNASPNLSVPPVILYRHRSLMITGPPPKFHGTRDILQRDAAGTSL